MDSNTGQTPALHNACAALWLATLSLMTAYLQNPSPAHRLMISRRIARNLETLARQDVFSTDCRCTFERLSGRWSAIATQLAQPDGLTAQVRTHLHSAPLTVQ